MTSGYKDLNWSDSEEEEDEGEPGFGSASIGLAPFTRFQRPRLLPVEHTAQSVAAVVGAEAAVATARPRPVRRPTRRFTPEEDAEILRLHARGLGWAEMVRESAVLEGRCRRVVRKHFKAVLEARSVEEEQQEVAAVGRSTEAVGAVEAGAERLGDVGSEGGSGDASSPPPEWLRLAREGHMLPPPVLPPPSSPLLTSAHPRRLLLAPASAPRRRVVNLADIGTL